MKLWALFMALTLFAEKASSQDLWTRRSINNILTFSFPSPESSSEISYLKEYRSQVGGNSYIIRFYDTTMSVRDQEEFKISLVGYADGFLREPGLKSYKICITDTLMNGMPGLMIDLKSSETSAQFQQIHCYITMANGQYYSFLVLSAGNTEKDPGVDRFFNSIVFDPTKIKESTYRLDFKYAN